MADNIHSDIARIVYSREVEDALRKLKKKDRVLFYRLENQISKILREPSIGKPLRYTMRNRRRVHLGSFVLVYEFHSQKINK